MRAVQYWCRWDGVQAGVDFLALRAVVLPPQQAGLLIINKIPEHFEPVANKLWIDDGLKMQTNS